MHQEYVNDCYSYSDLARKLRGYTNGTSFRLARKVVKENNLDISHFDRGMAKRFKYEIIKKKCPVCSNEFETQSGHSKEKTTCSHSCSNTYFRSGDNHPNWKDVTDESKSYGYRKVCFAYHKQECIVCGENKIVAVHHLDEDNKNSNPENLIPLCPTHHQYWHSRYKSEIEEIVENYIRDWKLNRLALPDYNHVEVG